jgi:hypothetical protein
MISRIINHRVVNGLPVSTRERIAARARPAPSHAERPSVFDGAGCADSWPLGLARDRTGERKYGGHRIELV